jgi:purine nucleosidase
MREAILIDTDPGQDDAVALLLAFASRDRLDLRAITTVAGNVPVAQTTANALRIRDLAGAAAAAVPVHAGTDRPLLFPLETAEFVCGPDGLAGADLPPARERAIAYPRRRGADRHLAAPRRTTASRSARSGR